MFVTLPFLWRQLCPPHKPLKMSTQHGNYERIHYPTYGRTLVSRLFARRGEHDASSMQFAGAIGLFQMLHPSFRIISADTSFANTIVERTADRHSQHCQP